VKTEKLKVKTEKPKGMKAWLVSPNFADPTNFSLSLQLVVNIYKNGGLKMVGYAVAHPPCEMNIKNINVTANYLLGWGVIRK
jgi:hypothetical protein